MFETKYTTSLLDINWNPLKRNVKLRIIPRTNEYIFLDSQYYKVINVIHSLNKKQDIFIIIDFLENNENKLDEKQIK